MLDELIYYFPVIAGPMFILACGIIMVLRFRGSAGAILGVVAFGILFISNQQNFLLSFFEDIWLDYYYANPLLFEWISLPGYACLVASLLTINVRKPVTAQQTLDNQSSEIIDNSPMPLGQILFSLRGRIDRGVFWGIWISMLVLNLILSFIIHVLAEEAPVIGLVSLLLLPFDIWIGLAMQAKRWHDRGKSAWMILINFIPVVGFIWAIVELGFLPGTVGSNRYGADPLQTVKDRAVPALA